MARAHAFGGVLLTDYTDFYKWFYPSNEVEIIKNNPSFVSRDLL